MSVLEMSKEELLLNMQSLQNKVRELERAELKHKKLKDEILDAKKTLENIFEGIGEGILLLSHDYKIIWANQSYLKQNGYYLNDIIGKFCYKVIHDKDDPKDCGKLDHPCPIKEVLKAGTALNLQHHHHGGPKKSIVEINAYPIVDEEGKTIQIIQLSREVTRHAKNTGKLQAPDALRDRIIEHTTKLLETNETLKQEVEERRQAEQKLMIYRDQLRSLAFQLTLAEEKQRRSIAHDLHEHLGMLLAIARVKLGALREDCSQKEQDIAEIIQLVEQSIAQTRSLTFELSPPILYDLGFEAAVEWLAEQMQKEHDLRVYFNEKIGRETVDKNIGIFLFQAVRALLANITEHAHARHVYIDLTKENGSINITIKDDGKGFDSAKLGFKTGRIGLFSIGQRLEQIGGKLSVKSKPGEGTIVHVQAPVNIKQSEWVNP